MGFAARVAGRWCAPLSLGLFVLGLRAQSLSVRLDGDALRVAAPKLHFLEGQPLERLHNGAVVTYLVQLSLAAETAGPPRSRAVARFSVSYDLWEEKFAVAHLGPARRAVSHLAASAAEAWCLDQLSLPLAGYPPAKPFWVRLEVRAEDPRETAPDAGDAGLSLSRLIELFSRPPRSQQPRWQEEGGPFRVLDLKPGAGPGPGRG